MAAAPPINDMRKPPLIHSVPQHLECTDQIFVPVLSYVTLITGAGTDSACDTGDRSLTEAAESHYAGERAAARYIAL